MNDNLPILDFACQDNDHEEVENLIAEHDEKLEGQLENAHTLRDGISNLEDTPQAETFFFSLSLDNVG